MLPVAALSGLMILKGGGVEAVDDGSEALTPLALALSVAFVTSPAKAGLAKASAIAIPAALDAAHRNQNVSARRKPGGDC